MYFRQRSRLLREDPWASAEDLAQELYAMFGEDVPLETRAPVTFHMQPDGSSPINIVNYAPLPDVKGLERKNMPAPNIPVGNFPTVEPGTFTYDPSPANPFPDPLKFDPFAWGPPGELPKFPPFDIPANVFTPGAINIDPYGNPNYNSSPIIALKGPDGSPVGEMHTDVNNYTYVTPGKPPISNPGTSTSVMPGVVVSGTGSIYSVKIFPNGLTGGEITTVTVKQLQIDPNATIPVGTWVMVGKNGTGSKASYFMQSPIWL